MALQKHNTDYRMLDRSKDLSCPLKIQQTLCEKSLLALQIQVWRIQFGPCFVSRLSDTRFLPKVLIGWSFQKGYCIFFAAYRESLWQKPNG